MVFLFYAVDLTVLYSLHQAYIFYGNARYTNAEGVRQI
jgi:hypothetical protein